MADLHQGQPNSAVPAPDYQGRPYGAEKALDEQAAGVPAAAAGPRSMPDVLAAASQAEPPRNLLDDPPNSELPFTSGMAMGDGPGPEALGLNTRPRVASMLDALAAATGSPAVASLAQEAAARNL